MDHRGSHDSSLTLKRAEASWYCFQNNSVQGPFQLSNILKLNQEGHDGKETLVCRRDFKRWYTLREIEPLLKTQDDFQRETAEDLERFHKHVDSNIESLRHLGEARSDDEEFAEGETTAAGAAKSEDNPPAPNSIDISHAQYDYYLLRGRLRLGQIASPFSAACIKWPLTLGFFWYLWLRRNFVELLWHGFNRHSVKGLLPPLVLSLVPGMHLYFAYKLAVLMRNVEKQNSYQRTSRVKAVLFALVPPLYIAYLQRQMNFHWQSHVKHFNIEKGRDPSLRSG